MYMSTTSQINAFLKVIGRRGFDGVSVLANNNTAATAAIASRYKLSLNAKKVASEVVRQNLVVIKPRDNHIKIQLTPAGAYRLQKVLIEEIQIKSPTKWDGKWRAITFDIPLASATNRMNFTNQLHRLGLKIAQKSVWVYPHKCFDEVKLVAEHYNVWRYCSYFEISATDPQTARKLASLFKFKK